MFQKPGTFTSFEVSIVRGMERNHSLTGTPMTTKSAAIR